LFNAVGDRLVLFKSSCELEMPKESPEDKSTALRRPRSSRGPRSVIIRTRVTAEEVIWLGQCAAYFELSLSAYTRLVILSRKLPPPLLTLEALNLLRDIGNDLDEAVGTLRWSCGQGSVQDEDLEFFEERCGKLYALLKKLTVKLEEAE
jgi:hypothetical protein